MGPIKKLAIQFQVLFTKNFFLAVRNWKGTLGQLISPLMIVLLLLGFQELSNYILSRSQEFPPTVPVGSFPRCTTHNDQTCTTVLYSPPNSQWVNYLMRNFSAHAGLNFERDFKAVGQGGYGEQAFFADNHTVVEYLVANPNKTQSVIMFYSAYAPVPFTGVIPNDVGYWMFYNSTAAYDYSLEFMRLLDEVVLKIQAGNESVNIIANQRTFPRPTMRAVGYDVVAANGGIWFYIPPMITFFIMLTEVVMEKEQRLRLGMRMMGLSSAVYWLVWLVTGAIFITLSTLVLIASGAACQFNFFLNSSFFAVFLLFFTFGVTMVVFAFFLSTLISKSKTAQTVGYAIVLVGFVFQTILCSGYGLLVDILFSPDLAPWVKFVRWLFLFYPPFNLSKVYSDIAALSSATFSVSSRMIVKGPGFYWTDMYKSRALPKILGLNLTVPAPIEGIYFLLLNSVVYGFLAWYLDNVLPGEHGSPKPFYFFLTPQYWGFHKKESK